jgi:hypothetical protein
VDNPLQAGGAARGCAVPSPPTPKRVELLRSSQKKVCNNPELRYACKGLSVLDAVRRPAMRGDGRYDRHCYGWVGDAMHRVSMGDAGYYTVRRGRACPCPFSGGGVWDGITGDRKGRPTKRVRPSYKSYKSIKEITVQTKIKRRKALSPHQGANAFRRWVMTGLGATTRLEPMSDKGQGSSLALLSEL